MAGKEELKRGKRSFGGRGGSELESPFLSRVKSRLVVSIFLPVGGARDPNFASIVDRPRRAGAKPEPAWALASWRHRQDKR